MKIEVSNYVEHEDGSASFQLDTDDEATKVLVQEGFTSLINKAIEEQRESTTN
jgi:predicted transcriptional regulator